jgi:2-haloacid dehalogenase
MQKIYKKLLFDLDNTLVDDDENRKYAIKKLLLERKEPVTEEKAETFINMDNQFWKDRAEGKIKDPYVFNNSEERTKWIRAQRFIKYFKGISFEEAVKMNNKYVNYIGEKIIPLKNAQEILKYLYNKNYEIYIVTNSPGKAVNNKLSKIGVQGYIKDTFSSDEAGHMKPHIGFFENFFKRIGSFEKNEMIIIGDELEKDVLGGIENGIDSCWVNIKGLDNNTNFKPNYEVRDLIELKKFL